MKTTLFSFFVLVMLLCYAGQRADAALISVTDPNSPGGANNVTHDTLTGFDWLDLIESNGISYNDITLQFGSGGTHDGWRHATRAEVTTLFTGSAGLTIGNQTIADPNAVQFVSLFGTTLIGPFNSLMSRGQYDDDATGTLINNAGSGSVSYFNGTGPPLNYTPDTTVIISDDQSLIKSAIPIGDAGHWLVRDASQSSTVPEPCTFALATLGLMGLAWLGWRKRR